MFKGKYTKGRNKQLLLPVLFLIIPAHSEHESLLFCFSANWFYFDGLMTFHLTGLFADQTRLGKTALFVSAKEV